MSCICEGNLRLIVSETSHLFGRWFKDEKGQVYTFYGVVIAEDDYYYGMTRHIDGKNQLLSCVGSIEAFGFELMEKNNE